MMRKERKGIILATLIMCCQLSVSEKAHAADYYTFNDHVLVYGVGDYGSDRQKYYITPSAETYRTQITNAMSDWIYTTDRLNYTTPISYRETSEYSKSRMDIYAASKGPYVGYNAQTSFYNDNISTGVIDKYKYSWTRNKITLNTTSNSVSNMTGPQIRGVFAHEMGHCFGLDENNGNTSSIMCTWANGRNVNKSQIIVQADMEEQSESVDRKIVRNISMSFDYELVLPTLEELKEKAPFIFEGKLEKIDSYVSSEAGGTIETDYYYEVTNAFTDNLQIGDIVKVNNVGGCVPCEEYFATVDKKSDADEKLAKQKNVYVESLIEGAPMPEIGKKYILFTGYFNGAYNVVGMNQGLFYPDGNGSYFRYYPKELSEKERIKGIKIQDNKLQLVDNTQK